MHYKQITIKLFFSFLLISSFCLSAESGSSINVSPPITVSPNFYNDMRPIINITNYFTSLSYTIGLSIKTFTLYCAEEIKKHLTDPQHYIDFQGAVSDFLWTQRYRISMGTVLTCYSSINLLLLNDYYFFNNNILWAQWKSESTFAQLCALSQQELAKDLLLAIGERNVNQQNPTDYSHPLISFMHTIDKEIKIIKRYIKTAKTIQQCKLMRIFPTNQNKIEHAEKLLERALFIKHIFLSWLAEHNFTNNNKNKIHAKNTQLREYYNNMMSRRQPAFGISSSYDYPSWSRNELPNYVKNEPF